MATHKDVSTHAQAYYWARVELAKAREKAKSTEKYETTQEQLRTAILLLELECNMNDSLASMIDAIEDLSE